MSFVQVCLCIFSLVFSHLNMCNTCGRETMFTQQTDPIRIMFLNLKKSKKTKHQLYFLSFRWVSNPVWLFWWRLAYSLFQVALPGYVEAFPHPRYPQGSSPRLPLHYGQAMEPPPTATTAASQQSLPDAGEARDRVPLSSLSTSALVQAIRQEVAKLAKKQTDMFEFQV